MESSWPRPSEDVIVSSLCVVENDEIESVPVPKQKDKNKSKIVKPPIQPSIICGVSLRRTKFPLNCEDEGGGNDVRTEEVQLMNKVNEVVSGDKAPQIITNSSDRVHDGPSITTDYLDSTVFTPYILVVSGQEGAKTMWKQVSMDSLKRSTSAGNVPSLLSKQVSIDSLKQSESTDHEPTLCTLSLNQQWSFCRYMDMYDSDPDCQIVNVTPAPGTLSANSPTEGTSTSKQDTKQENIEEEKQPSSSGEESAIKVPHTFPKPGAVLQCMELPQDLQSEYLYVKSIAPTLDRQHIVVVVGARTSEKSSQSVIKSPVTDQGSSLSDAETGSFNPLAHSTSNSDKSSTEQSDIENQVENMDVTKSETEISETSTSSGSHDCNCNKSSDDLKEQDSSRLCKECILIYRINFSKVHNYAVIEETPVVTKYLEEADGIIDSVVILSKELSEHVEEEEFISCDEGISVPTPSQASIVNERVTGIYGQMAVIFSSGCIAVFNCSDLSLLADIKPQMGDRFTGVTYCSGIDRLCLCSSLGKLYFYQISEGFPNQTDSLAEGNLTPITEALENQVPSGSFKTEVLDTSSRASGKLIELDILLWRSLSPVYA